MENIEQLRLKAKLFNGFSDVSRLRIFQTLIDKPMNVGEIVKLTELSQPNVSSHLKCLNDCNLVKAKKVGRKVFYSPINDKIKEMMRLADDILQYIYSDINSCVNYEVSI